MSEVIFVCWKRCSTCRNAQKYLDAQKVDYAFRDIMDETPSSLELKKWVEKSKLPLENFFNRSGVMYREMNLKETMDSLSEDEKFELLASNGRLMKRPILITPKGVVLGFKEEAFFEVL